MLFNQISLQSPELQRQLDADRQTLSRRIQLETEGAFTPEELRVFQMEGLFGEMGESQDAMRINRRQADS